MSKEEQYIDINKPIIIGCKKCGEYFKITPKKHLEGYGCKTCYPYKKGELVKTYVY